MGKSKGAKHLVGKHFNPWQYKFLKLCSGRSDEGIKRWNEWREKNPNDDILLDGADLSGWYLEGADLNAWLSTNVSGKTHWFKGKVYLRDVLLWDTKLRCSNLSDAHLEGADFWHTRLEHAKLHSAIVDGGTLFWRCKVSRETDFRGVGLDSARIDAGTKQLLKYNIRRLNWERWYKEHWLLRWPVRAFWWVSDYGRSIGRIIFTFFVLAVAFAVVYWFWPGCVMVNGVVGDIRGFVHALYFSVVTMTTLGFGDIAANPDSWQGQVLLMLQVILGYVLLGALVTRFAVLFTAGGPAGKFSKETRYSRHENQDKE